MKLPHGWEEVELGEVLDYEQPTNYIVSSEKYNNKYKTPVLTAGKSFILGYTNEIEGVFNKLPVIIFDDFTTASQFVTFPFKVKSSAMKLLTPKTKDIDLKYIFWLMQTIKVDSNTHKRYYLSNYQHTKIALPSLQTQRKIVSILEKVEKAKEWRKEADELIKDFLKSVFLEMFKDKTKFEMVELGDKKISKEIFAGGDVPKSNFSKIRNDKYDIPIYTNGEKNKGFYGYTSEARVTQPSITISARGTIGYSEIRKENFYPAIRLIVITPKKEVLNLYFLKYAIDEINFELSGTSIHQLTVPMIKRYKIPLPPIELQNKFASIVKEVESVREQQKHSKEQINNLFNALMQKAFRGKLKC